MHSVEDCKSGCQMVMTATGCTLGAAPVQMHSWSYAIVVPSEMCTTCSPGHTEFHQTM